MDLTFVMFVGILPFAEMIWGEYHTTCPAQPIKAEEGTNATLQCFLYPWVNAVDHTVECRRVDVDRVVHVYRSFGDDPDPQTNEYRGRTSLNHEALQGGVLTLQISSVKLSDSGCYGCFVSKSNMRTGCTVTLSVDPAANELDTLKQLLSMQKENTKILKALIRDQLRKRGSHKPKTTV